MAKSVEEKVKEIIVEQLGVEEDDVTPNGEVHRGSGRRLPRYGRARDGPGGALRHPDPRRGRREDRRPSATPSSTSRTTRKRRGARDGSSSPGSGPSRPSATPPTSSGRPCSQGRSGIGPITQVRRHGLSDPDRRRGPELRSAEVRRQEGGAATRSVPPVRDRRRCHGRAGRRARHRQGRRHAVRRADRLGHRRHHHAPRGRRTSPREGPRPRVAVLHPHDDRQHGARTGVDAVRRQGPELLGRHRLRHRQPRHRRRRPSSSSAAMPT